MFHSLIVFVHTRSHVPRLLPRFSLTGEEPGNKGLVALKRYDVHIYIRHNIYHFMLLSTHYKINVSAFL